MRANPGRKVPAQSKFAIVKNTLPEDAFHAKLNPGRGSWKTALQQLANAPRGSVLRVENTRAYPAVHGAAKKLGYTCWYAKDGEALLVQIVITGEDK